ncbi:hypothetical protein MPER_09664 [Moniliophthora perniciosa FA553]|nr:hypothetical protein MPER_09664 [Moniliophthora perniciosa FA553]
MRGDEIRIRSPAPLLYPRFTRPGHRVRDCPNKDSNSAPVPIQEKKPLPKETQKTSAPKLFPDAPNDPAERYRYYLAIAEQKRNSRNPEPKTTPDPEPTESSGLESGTSELISEPNLKPAMAISENLRARKPKPVLTKTPTLKPIPEPDNCDDKLFLRYFATAGLKPNGDYEKSISESDDTGSESTITKPLTDSEDLKPEPTSGPRTHREWPRNPKTQ